jgi:hypothetical protein
MCTISGLHPTACSLDPSSFPAAGLPGLPVNFTTDLLAKLWSSGIFTVCEHPLGNTIEFPELSSIPIDLGLPWRDYISCLIRKFGRSGNLLDVLMEGANYCDDGFIAAIAPFNVVGIAYTYINLDRNIVDG